jgi:hypothetical protein
VQSLGSYRPLFRGKSLTQRPNQGNARGVPELFNKYGVLNLVSLLLRLAVICPEYYPEATKF